MTPIDAAKAMAEIAAMKGFVRDALREWRFWINWLLVAVGIDLVSIVMRFTDQRPLANAFLVVGNTLKLFVYWRGTRWKRETFRRIKILQEWRP